MKLRQIGHYLISECGKVYSIAKPRKGVVELKYDKDRIGYKRATLCFNGRAKKKLVHRLVAELFIPNPENYPIVNHIDGDKQNNHIKNLEWCTRSYNEHHAHKFLGKIPPMAKLVLNTETGIYYQSITKAAEAHCIKPSTLLNRLSVRNPKKSKFILC